MEQPSAFRGIPNSSPLDTLVRRASNKRQKNKEIAAEAGLQQPLTPPRQFAQQQWATPPSPLLHTQFRSSVASTTVSAYDTGSYMAEDSERSWEQHGQHPTGMRQPIPRHYHPPSFREQSVASAYSQFSVNDIMDSYRDSYLAPTRDPPRAPPSKGVPAVVISSAEPKQSYPTPPLDPSSNQGGRVPSRLPPGTSNFSRPAPPPIHGSQEQKRQVLARNVHNHVGSPLGNAHPPVSSGLSPGAAPMATQQHSRSVSPTQQSPAPEAPRSNSQASLHSTYSYYPYGEGNSIASRSNQTLTPTPAARSPSPSSQTPRPQTPKSQISTPQPQQSPGARSTSSNTSNNMKHKFEDVVITNPQTAQDYLQLGINHHLANRLRESAECFEKSATLNGGCGMGMLMWGLTQRHGWGVPQSEQKGFKWLRRAAELAVGDLEGAKGGSMDTSAVKSELVLAIYEVGQSFFHAWGVEKDKTMAVSYYRLAAKLGDPDAQQDLAFCLANGKGCKKDRKEAAKWYRAAVAQGVSDIGLAWIYKEKYL